MTQAGESRDLVKRSEQLIFCFRRHGCAGLSMQVSDDFRNISHSLCGKAEVGH